MHPGSQFGLTNSWRDLVAQEEIGNVQCINLSIMLEGQQGWGEVWVTPKQRLMSAGHSLPFFLSGRRRWITTFFFFFNEQVSPSSQSHQNESSRNIETIYVLHLEQTPAQSRCWINLLAEWICIMSVVWQTNWNDTPNDNRGNSDLLDLGDLLLRAIQKVCGKPWG